MPKLFVKVFMQALLWLVVANGLFALGSVFTIQKMLYLPEYGQGFWWAWGAAFTEASENILFICIGLAALVLLLRRNKSLRIGAKHG